MALGKVTVTTGALGPGSFPEPEGVALFLGESTTGQGAAAAVGVNSDFETLFGAGNLKDTLEHARANGGPRWKAYAVGHAGGESWADAIDVGLAAVNPEMIVACKPVTAAAELTAMQTQASTLLNLAKRVFFLAAARGIDNTPVTGDADWAAYLAVAQAITTGVAGQRVMAVPLLFGSELGTFAGKLAKFALEDKTVARSPMRVRSGAVVNPGAKPFSDLAAGDPLLDIATLEALDTARFSVFQWHEGKEGIYAADANTLETAGGDFPVVEWLRVTDKAARRVRLLAINAIADDAVQDTPAGNAAFASYLASPLRTMAQGGEIKPPRKGDITVEWTGLTTVKLYMTVRAINAPKDITVAILLDTTNG